MLALQRLTPRRLLRLAALALAVTACAQATPPTLDDSSEPEVLSGVAGRKPPTSGGASMPSDPGPALGGAQPSGAPAGGPRLIVDSPARGARVEGGSVRVSGRLEGSAARAVTVQGQALPVGPNGAFSGDVPATAGLNVLVTATDDGGVHLEDRRGVLVSADADPAAPLEHGAVIKVGAGGFARIAELVAQTLNGLDLTSLANANAGGDIRVRQFSHGPIGLTLNPEEGRVDAILGVVGLNVAIDANVDLPIFGRTDVSGSMSTNAVVLIANLVVQATPEGSLTIDIANSAIDLGDMRFSVDGVPDFVLDWFRGVLKDLAEDTIKDALNGLVLPALFDPASLQRTIDVLGHPVGVGLLMSRVEMRKDGLELWTDVRTEAEDIVHPGAAVRPLGGIPNMQAQSHLDIAASGDLVTRLLHTVWAAGVLDLSLDENSGIESPIPLTAALLAAPLGAAAEGVDRNQPLRIGLRPLVPPVARVEAGDKPLVIEAADLLLDLSTPNDGTLVTVALHLVAKLSFAIAPDPMTGALGLQPEIAVEAHADVAETPRGPVNEAQLETLLQGMMGAIPGFIADQTFAFGPDALSVPLTLTDARLEADNPGAYLHVRANLGH